MIIEHQKVHVYSQSAQDPNQEVYNHLDIEVMESQFRWHWRWVSVGIRPISKIGQSNSTSNTEQKYFFFHCKGGQILPCGDRQACTTPVSINDHSEGLTCVWRCLVWVCLLRPVHPNMKSKYGNPAPSEPILDPPLIHKKCCSPSHFPWTWLIKLNYQGICK